MGRKHKTDKSSFDETPVTLNRIKQDSTGPKDKPIEERRKVSHHKNRMFGRLTLSMGTILKVTNSFLEFTFNDLVGMARWEDENVPSKCDRKRLSARSNEISSSIFD